MPQALALLLMSLGCAPAQFHGPAGPFVVWVCPPIEPAGQAPDAPEEREG